MKRSIVLSLALALMPAAALAQGAPPPGPPGMAGPAPTASQPAAMRQMHAQAQALRVQTRSRIVAALTPAHRTAVANLFGQLALSPNPDPRGAAQSLDAMFSAAEKQSIVAVATAEHEDLHSLMQQARAQFESTLSADQRARMARHEAEMKSIHQRRGLAAEAADPGTIVLHTLGSFGGPGMHGPGMHGGPF